MLFRTLILAGFTATIGFAAGRVTQAGPEKAPRELARPSGKDATDIRASGEPRPGGSGEDATNARGDDATPPAKVAESIADEPTADEPAVDDPGVDDPGDDAGDEGDGDGDGGEDVGELLAAAARHAEELRRERNAIFGRVVDWQSGEPLAGVTVIATSGGLAGAQTAITDEHGNYEITALPIGSYMLTFYYDSVTATRDGVPVSSLSVTRDLEVLDTSAPAPSISFTGTEDMENTYLVDTVDTLDDD